MDPCMEYWDHHLDIADIITVKEPYISPILVRE